MMFEMPLMSQLQIYLTFKTPKTGQKWLNMLKARKKGLVLENLLNFHCTNLYVFNGAPSKNRTRNPQIRSLILYPVELLAHINFYILKLFIQKRKRKITCFSPLFSIISQSNELADDPAID